MVNRLEITISIPLDPAELALLREDGISVEEVRVVPHKKPHPTWSRRSLDNLAGIHDDLRDVCNTALEKCVSQGMDFVVIDGLRTPAEQEDFVAKGVSWTMNSRHLYGAAVDIAALVNGKVRWEAELYKPIWKCFLEASKELGVPIVWGGKWKQKDWGHFELDRKHYPDKDLKRAV